MIKILFACFAVLLSTNIFIDWVHAELNQKQFEKLHQDLQPDERAVWRSIPWKISLLDGQQEAGETAKPIFIWAMDGHPLGCT